MEFRNHYLAPTDAGDDILGLNASDSDVDFDIDSGSATTLLLTQAKIVDHLRGARGGGGVRHTYSALTTRLSITFTPSLISRLSSNPRIVHYGEPLTFNRSTHQPDLNVEGGLVYEPKFNVKDKVGILRLVQSRGNSGVLGHEISDCYPAAGEHLQELVDEGCIGGIPRKGEYGSAKKSKYPAVQSVVFPRNGSYLVEVGRGKVVMDTVEGLNISMQKDRMGGVEDKVRRGEGLRIVDDKGYVLNARVSSEVKAGVGRFEQIPKAVAPLTLSSNKDLRPRANFVRELKGTQIPLAVGFQGEREVEVYRYGCSKKVKGLWSETASIVPKDDPKLVDMMVRYKIGVPNEVRQERVKHAPKAEVGKKRKSYVEKKNRISTNTHLEGTEAGEQLKRMMKKAREQR